MALMEGTQWQFTVIGRLRPGVQHPTHISIYHFLKRQLKQYRFSHIRFSEPYFLIYLKTPKQQLQLLAEREIKGSDFIMDLLPWCTQYESCDLPWFVFKTKVIKLGPLKPYMENLIGQPQERHISNILKNWTVESPIMKPYMENLRDDETKEGMIYVDAVQRLELDQSTSTTGACADKLGCTDARIGHPGMVPARQPRPLLDFSYMMLLELQDFYYQKHRAFVKCKQSCQKVFNITRKVYKHRDLILDPIYELIKYFQGMSGDQTVSHITEFGCSVKHVLSYAKNEIGPIKNTMRLIYQQSGPPIDLSRFGDSPSVYQAYTGEPHPIHLKTVLNAFTLKMNKEPAVSVRTMKAAYGTFETYITGINLSKVYISFGSTTEFEAEANAIYQFLRDSTNFSGYHIVDENYSTLARLMSELNSYAEEVSRLHCCAQMSAAVVHRIRKDIHMKHMDLLMRVPTDTTGSLNTLVLGLLEWLQAHCNAADEALDKFKQDKLINGGGSLII